MCVYLYDTFGRTEAIKHLDNTQYALHIILINTMKFMIVVNSLIAL